MTCEHSCDHDHHDGFDTSNPQTSRNAAILTQMVAPWALVAVLVILGFVLGGVWGFAVAGVGALIVGALMGRGWQAATGPQRMAWLAAFTLVAALSAIQWGR